MHTIIYHIGLAHRRQSWGKLDQNLQKKHRQFNLFAFTVITGKIELLARVRESKQDFWQAGLFPLCSVLFPVFHLCFICLHCRLGIAEKLGKRDPGTYFNSQYVYMGVSAYVNWFWKCLYVFAKTHLWLPTRTVPLTAEPVVKAMESTRESFQEQQLHK